MALKPWEIDRTTGVTYTTSPTSKNVSTYKSTSSGADYKYKDPGSYVRSKTGSTSGSTSSTRTGSYSGHSSGGSRTSSTSKSTSSGGSSKSSSGSSSTPKPSTRTPGGLPLTAEELAAFAAQRRSITRSAQEAQANAARMKALALEDFKLGRFHQNSEAQALLRGAAMDASAMGRGQARSSLATSTPFGQINRDLARNMGTLNRNLSAGQGAADASSRQALIDRDAALAQLEQNIALRKSLPSGFFMQRVA